MSAKIYSQGDALYHAACLTPEEIEDAVEVNIRDLEVEEACGNCNELLLDEDDEEQE